MEFLVLRSDEPAWVTFFQEGPGYAPQASRVYKSKYEAEIAVDRMMRTGVQAWFEPVMPSIYQGSSVIQDDLKRLAQYMAEGDEYDDYLWREENGEDTSLHVHWIIRRLCRQFGLRQWFEKLWPEYEEPIDYNDIDPGDQEPIEREVTA